MAVDSIHRNGSSSKILDSFSDIISSENAFPFNEIYEIPQQNVGRCHIYNQEMYESMYKYSINDPDNFWKEMANANLRWIQSFGKVSSGGFGNGDISWFLNGKLNVCDNCVDRWAELDPERIAIIWEGDQPDQIRRVSYKELLTQVCKCANLLKQIGVKKGDIVCIYMPMIPETVYCMLACARIGAVHSVVFAGFSSASLIDRLTDTSSQVIITVDQGIRGGKIIPLKNITDDALGHCPAVKSCIVFKYLGHPIQWVHGRDLDAISLLNEMRPYCPLTTMDSEDNLFILYTSGSTGKPKGIVHTSAGYLLYAAISHKYIFDVHPGDVYACLADIGWVTGHSYIVYGPLCNGSTTFMFESLPTYPDAGRYWSLIERHKITQFYTAPTAIRALMRLGDHWPQKYDLSSLRILGTVGEPINPEAWRWYYSVIGKSQTSLVDTYWQTETGATLLTPLPGATRTKPGSASLPFFGVKPAILDPSSGKELTDVNTRGVLCISKPWPGIMRSVFKSHTRYMETYFKPFPGYYFTGDGVTRDSDGFYWISGRVDDTLNVAGHRFGAAEIEHALVQSPITAEAAVVGFPHDLKGSGIFCYVTLKDSALSLPVEIALAELKKSVRANIGPVATPDVILLAPGLPKTRSGKIMRRILRYIASDRSSELGDLSTLSNPEVIDELIKSANELKIK